jgi:hypothetical protein
MCQGERDGVFLNMLFARERAYIVGGFGDGEGASPVCRWWADAEHLRGPQRVHA